MTRRCLWPIMALLLAGCAVGPDYEQPDLVEEVPTDWHLDMEYKHRSGEPLGDMAWVEIFQDEQLRFAVEQALINNRTLRVAMERIEEARAINRITEDIPSAAGFSIGKGLIICSAKS